MKQSSRMDLREKWKWLSWTVGSVLVATPAIALGLLILHFGVDVPYWDEWSVLGFAEAFHLHVLTFSQLFSQYNEDRLFFPRLILLTIDALANGNVKGGMLGTFLLACLAMFNVFWLARQTARNSSRWALVVLVSLLIFSPIQYENWLWGHQFSNLMPVACLTTALAIAYSNLDRWWSLGLAAALATVATFSYVNGTMCWFLLIPVLLLRFQSAAEKLRAGAIWAAFAAVNLAAFFYHYRFLSDSSNPGSLLAHKELVFMSLLSLIGAPLSFGTGFDPERVAHFAGAVILLLAGIAILRLIGIRSTPGILGRSLPWLAIGGFALATGILVTFGRATSSSQRLLESRYTSFSVYMLVALIFLWSIVFEDAHLRPWVGRFLVSLLLLLHFFTARYALRQMAETRTDRLQAKACLAFFNVIDDACQTQRLDWEAGLLRQRVQSLQRLHYFHPRLVQSSDLRQIAAAAGASSNEYGVLESLTNAGSGFYQASGWATLAQRSEPADAVVLSYLRADGEPVAFALAGWMKAPSRDAPSRRSNWEKWFELPPGADRIQAWAYDALAGRAFLMSGEQRASNAPPTGIRFMTRARGFVDSGEFGSTVTLGGWAVLLDQYRPADMVFLTCGPEHAIVAAGQPWSIRPDVARELGDGRFLKSGWQIPVPARKIPPGCQMSAWAYDSTSHQAGSLQDLRHLQANPR